MNPFRGDFEIELGGKNYLLRPDFDALCEIEEAIQGPYSIIMNEAREMGMPRFKHMAIVVWACMRAGMALEKGGSLRGCPQLKEVGQMMQSQGVTEAANVVTKLLSYMLLTDEQIKEIEAGESEEGQEKDPSSGVESPNE